MRKAIHHVVTTSPAVLALVPADRVYERSAVPDSPVKPFVVLGFTGAPRQGGQYASTLQVNAYTERGDFLLAVNILRQISLALEPVVNLTYEDSFLSQVIPGSYGPDLFDDQWRANLLQLDFTVVGRDF